MTSQKTNRKGRSPVGIVSICLPKHFTLGNYVHFTFLFVIFKSLHIYQHNMTQKLVRNIIRNDVPLREMSIKMSLITGTQIAVVGSFLK